MSLLEPTQQEIILMSIIVSIIIICISYIGIKTMRKWRPKDKNKPQILYNCTVCGVPFTAQQGLITHMKDVHDKWISAKDTKMSTSEVSYEDWEQVRLNEESNMEQFEDEQESVDERVVNRLTNDPDEDPDKIIPENTTDSPEELYKQTSKVLEQPNISLPSEDLFSVKYMGDRVFIDIAMTVPNTPEVVDAINKLNHAMSK